MRSIAGKTTKTFVEGEDRITMTFIEPAARVYRRVMQSAFRIVGGEIVPEFGATIDELMDVALDSLIEVSGAEAEFEGIKYAINSALNVKNVNEVTGRLFAGWKEVYINTHPDFVRALAMYYYTRMSTASGLPKEETADLEKNSERASGGS